MVDIEMENILKRKNRPMHYDEIIKELKNTKNIKYNTAYSRLRKNLNILSNGRGIYALKDWKDKLPEEFKLAQKSNKQILEHGYNKYENYTIKYNITKSVFKNKSLRVPSNVPIDLFGLVLLNDMQRNEYYVEYQKKYKTLVRIDIALNSMQISEDEIIYLELIDDKNIIIYREYEYIDYLKNGKDFNKTYDNRVEIADSAQVQDLLSLFKKE